MKGFLLLLLGLGSLALPAQDKLDQPIDPAHFKPETLRAALYFYTAQARDSLGAPAQKINVQIQSAADYQASLMANQKTVSHRWRRPREASTPGKRLLHFKYPYSRVSENLARVFLLNTPAGKSFRINTRGQALDKSGVPIPNKSYRQLAQYAVNGWLASPGHRQNLLGPEEEIGIGISKLVPDENGLDFDVYLTQKFASPWELPFLCFLV